MAGKLKLAAFVIFAVAILIAFIHYQSVKNDRDDWKYEFTKLKAESKPDTVEADSVFVIIEDSTKIKSLANTISRLRAAFSQANIPDTVLETIIDTIQTLADIPCDKKVRGEYLYQKNGVTAHIGAETDCRRELMTFAVGAYADPVKRGWGWGIDIFGGYKPTKFIPGAGIKAITPWGFDVGIMFINDAIGIKFGYNF